MSTNKHLIEQEELMAYLDGELSPDRALAAAEHLNECRECQSIAGDLQSVSRRVMAWQVELPEGLKIKQNLGVALDERSQKSSTVSSNRRSWREAMRIPRLPRWAWGSGIAVIGLVVVFLVLLTVSFQTHHLNLSPRPEKPARTSTYTYHNYDQLGPVDSKPTSNGKFSEGYVASKGLLAGSEQSEAKPSDHGSTRESDAPTNVAGPMIVRTAELTLITKEFDKARADLEAILKKHRGYVGQLEVSVPSGSGRTLNATLRVPADQLDATLAELKKLGRVDAETQSGEEVTQQYVDLVARLANARNSEQRLTEILRQRTGKLSDVLAVEVEIDRVRGEIERMEAERKNLAHQVDFATLTATLTEEYENELQAVPVSTWTRMRNSAVEGYTSLTESIIGLILFLLSYGPNILVWGGLLLLILYFAWKQLRKRLALN